MLVYVPQVATIFLTATNPQSFNLQKIAVLVYEITQFIATEVNHFFLHSETKNPGYGILDHIYFIFWNEIKLVLMDRAKHHLSD